MFTFRRLDCIKRLTADATISSRIAMMIDKDAQTEPPSTTRVDEALL